MPGEKFCGWYWKDICDALLAAALARPPPLTAAPTAELSDGHTTRSLNGGPPCALPAENDLMNDPHTSSSILPTDDSANSTVLWRGAAALW